jgi:hypothetical protein
VVMAVMTVMTCHGVRWDYRSGENDEGNDGEHDVTNLHKNSSFDGPDECGTPVIEAYMVNQYRNKKFSSAI